LFDDLDTAIATAESLSNTEEGKPPSVSDLPLVSFLQTAAEGPLSMPRVVTQPPAPPTLPPSQKARPASQKLILSRTSTALPASATPATPPPSVVSTHEPAPSALSVAASTAPAPDVASASPAVAILTTPPESPPVVAIPPVVMPAAPARVTSSTVVPPTAASPVAPAFMPAHASPAIPAAPASPHDASHAASEDTGEHRKVPPKLPDLTGIASPVVRCERIVSWIAEATGAHDVFLADASGYPLAGAVDGVDAKLAGTGLVAASVASLAASIPGNVSSLFELHLGEGPFFQLIGFQAGASVYVVGFTRGAPLTPRQSHAIRLACRHALGDTLKGGLWETE
jgi:hypothetical protein